MKADTKATRIAKLAKSIAFKEVVYSLKAAREAASPYWIHHYQERANQAKLRYRTIRSSMA